MRLDRALRLGCWASLACLVGAISLRQIRSVDYWWHLATGDWIARTHGIPRVDVFTYSVAGAPYVDIHWLHQLGLHALYTAGGHDAVIVAKLVLLSATVTCLAFAIARWDRPGLLLLSLALGLCAVSERVTTRPELTSFTLLAAELLLLERFWRRPGPGVFAIVALQLVWANVHGLFMLGLGVVGMAFVGEALDAFQKGRQPDTGRKLAMLAGVGLASAVVSLLNPSGLRGLLYPVQQLLMIGTAGMRESVGLQSAELRPLAQGWRETDPVVLVGFAGLAGLGALALVAEVRRLRAFDVLLWSAFVGLSLMAVRNVALLGVVGPLVLARNAGSALDRWPAAASLDRALALALCPVVLAFAAWSASGRDALALRTTHTPGFGVIEELFPVGAADWIERERPPGPLYHHMADGGYLIWRLHPDYPVLADGRLEVFGNQASELFQTSPRGFEALDRRFHFGTALLGYNHYDFDALLPALLADRDWRLAYVDEVSAVFVRRARGAAFVPDLDPRSPDLFPEQPAARSLADLFAHRGRARFYAATRQPLRAAREVEVLRERYPAWVGGP